MAGFVPTAVLQYCSVALVVRLLAWSELTDCLYVCACLLACLLNQAIVCTMHDYSLTLPLFRFSRIYSEPLQTTETRRCNIVALLIPIQNYKMWLL